MLESGFAHMAAFRALSEPTGHRRPRGADGGAGREGDKAHREADKALGGNRHACWLREADDMQSIVRNMALADRWRVAGLARITHG
jgi:hypothetical protein